MGYSTCTPERIELLQKAQRVAELGFTDVAIAEFLGVAPKTIENWKNKAEGFRELLEQIKAPLDDQVEASLFRRATGYQYTETKVTRDKEGNLVKEETVTKGLAPDTTACIFWLKNRRGDHWRDVRERVNIPSDTGDEEVNYNDLARRLLFLFDQISKATPSITMQ